MSESFKILNLSKFNKWYFVFSSEPISVLKYKELGIESFFVPIEADGKVFKDYGLKKIYQVLHFGRDKTIRGEYINHLEKNGINLFEYEEKYIYIIKDLIQKIYVEAKSELIIWWVFESISPEGKVLPLIDEDLKEHVIKTPKQLVKFLKRYNGK